jgi:hypothetical protein
MTLAMAHRMPTVKIAVPNTKTWGGMPILVAPYTHTGNGVAAPDEVRGHEVVDGQGERHQRPS